MLVCVCECGFLIYIGTDGKLLAHELVLGGADGTLNSFLLWKRRHAKFLNARTGRGSQACEVTVFMQISRKSMWKTFQRP